MSLGPISKFIAGYAAVAEKPLLREDLHEKDLEALRESEDSSTQGALSDADTLNQQEPVVQKGFKVSPRVISDAIIGLSDGLTVPFALTAGLSAFGDTKVVIFGGLAELTAGAISMGLGGYLGAKSEEASYRQTEEETREAITNGTTSVQQTITEVFATYNVPPSLVDDLSIHISKSSQLPEFLLRFQHGMSEPPASRAVTCALTIACGYFIGGFIPLTPYFFVDPHDVYAALWASVGVMALALMAFGYSKTCFVTGWKGSKNIWGGVIGGLQMVIVGGIAAGAAMVLVRAFQQLGGT